jgi:hypothetical protein
VVVNITIGRPDVKAEKVVRPRLSRKTPRSMPTNARGRIHEIGIIAATL